VYTSDAKGSTKSDTAPPDVSCLTMPR